MWGGGGIRKHFAEISRNFTDLPPLPTCLVHLYCCCCCFSFQVGCGAIGCELLKNFALLGIAGSENGMVLFIFLLTFSDMFRHFDFRTVFVCSF